MTADPEEQRPPTTAASNHLAWRETYESSLKHFTERKLVLMLAAIHARMGTSEELPGDLDRCRAISERLKEMHPDPELRESQRKMDPKRRFF